MNVSGILVVVPSGRLNEAVRSLSALPGVDVHHTDPATGRIIVTQEGASIRHEVEGLKRIKSLPEVILAELVHHHFEEDREIVQAIPDELDGERLGPRPQLLRDASTDPDRQTGEE